MSNHERRIRESSEQEIHTDLDSAESLPVGELGSLDDSPGNLPGSQADPKMPDSKVDPDTPISSAKGTA